MRRPAIALGVWLIAMGAVAEETPAPFVVDEREQELTPPATAPQPKTPVESLRPLERESNPPSNLLPLPSIDYEPIAIPFEGERGVARPQLLPAPEPATRPAREPGRAHADQSTNHAVVVPVLDVRSQPGSLPVRGAHDVKQETQLLYGERVRVIRTEGDWALIEAPDQPEYTHAESWQGYPGWVPRFGLQWVADNYKPNAVVTAKWLDVWEDPNGARRLLQLPLGAYLQLTTSGDHLSRIKLVNGRSGWVPSSRIARIDTLRGRPKTERRDLVVDTARLLLDDPYFWGGRSPAAVNDVGTVTGVDCSALVNLAYRAAGLDIPRDAHDQSMEARPIDKLQPGDLVFLSEANNPAKIVHVMLYAGEEWLIEGPGTGSVVRQIRVKDRLGKPLERVKPGLVVNGQTVSFGAFLP